MSTRGHISQLILVFCVWKALLLGLAAFCPGPGYDTSAFILFGASTNRHENFSNLSRHGRLILNLFRWDAIYFVKGAERGKIHEQEWAFSWAYSHLLRLTGQLFSGGVDCPLQYYIVAGIVVSNVCHLLSVLVLYRLLTLTLEHQQQRPVAFVASVLHILTPASLFLSAPYAEACFSLLNLAGMLCYAQSKLAAKSEPYSLREDAYKLSSGLLFGFATLVRSNGLLSGLILLYDVAEYLPRLVSLQLSIRDVSKVIITCVAGSFIACGFVWPQYLAYIEFCSGESNLSARPWCEKSVPSIYSWVQSHYWNVGLFRYWTFPNLPLFLLAAPVVWLLLESSVTVLRIRFQGPLHGTRVQLTSTQASPRNSLFTMCNLPELALPQFVLALTAVTSFHIQIVNRIASGYPIWYAAIADLLLSHECTHIAKKGEFIVRGIIIYTLVQGMLFANFLPPA